MTLHQLRAAW